MVGRVGGNGSAMTRRPSRLLMVPAAVLGLGFFVWPTISILDLGLRQDPGRVIGVITDPTLRSVAWFTLWQACVSTALALMLGVPAALALARFEFRGRRAIRTILTLPFVLPTVVVATAFLALAGPQGVLGFDLAGTVWVVLAAHVFFNLAVVIRTVGGLAAHIDPALDDAARTLGASPWRRIRTVTLPLLQPAIIAAGAIVFLFSLTSFGVVLLLGAPRLATLEVEIYRSAALIFDLPTAASLALIQLVGVGAALLVYSGRRSQTTQQLVSSSQRLPIRGRRLAVTLATAPAVVLVALPLGAIAWRTFVAGGSLGLGAFRALIDLDPSVVDPVAAIGNSLRNGLIAGFLALGVGLPAAHFVAAGRTRSTRWFDALIMIPLGASAVTLGFGMVVALDSPIDLRAWWLLVPIAHAVIAVPFVVRIVVPVASAIDPHLREAAATLGATPSRIWRTVDLPMLTPAIAAAAVLAFIVSVGEFGATLFVARPGGQTMTLAIYRLLGRPGGGSGSAAFALATLLIIVTAVAVVGLERLRSPAPGAF
jgi:thiamine transport system permease protein